MKAKAEGDADRISSCAALCGDVSDGLKKKKNNKKCSTHFSQPELNALDISQEERRGRSS